MLSAVQKIEGLVGHDSLDIEFAVTRDGDVHILQVRPIARERARRSRSTTTRSRRAVHHAQRDRARPHGAGARRCSVRPTRYSVMTDWNPAEIVGTTPRALALSLYRFLVTDDVWARQRAEYGYRDVRPCPLLVEIAGHPYVDVRACFNSFVPAALDDDLATPARRAPARRARRAPGPPRQGRVRRPRHVSRPDLRRARADELPAAGFAAADVDALRAALRDDHRGTRSTGSTPISPTSTSCGPTLATMAPPDACRSTPPPTTSSSSAGAARRCSPTSRGPRSSPPAWCAALVRGRRGRRRERADEYLATTETVFGRLQADAAAVRAGELDWTDFVDRYGHLRPGTYDITSPRYAAAPEEYLRPLVDQADAADARRSAFAWTRRRARRDRRRARRARVCPIDVDGLDRFVRGAIAGREDGKFVFTRSLSDALEALAEFGATLGFDRDDLAHVRIDDLLRVRDALADPRGVPAAPGRGGRRGAPRDPGRGAARPDRDRRRPRRASSR